MDCPCRYCESRALGCHAVCGEYQKYRQIFERERNRRTVEYKTRGILIDAMLKTTRRWKK